MTNLGFGIPNALSREIWDEKITVIPGFPDEGPNRTGSTESKSGVKKPIALHLSCQVFTNNVHVAAIRTTGNVFSYEAINELNIKTKNWKDLLSSEPFARKDIVVLQDPQDTSKQNMNSFHHLKNDFKVCLYHSTTFYLQTLCQHAKLYARGKLCHFVFYFVT